LQHAVAIDPALLCVFDVVVHNKQIDRADQLKVAYVRQKIGLHDGYLHLLTYRIS
jgi:hypothetical protein